MRLWEKMKQRIKGSVEKISEKSTDLIETGSELAQEGIQKLTESRVDAVEVSRLQIEVELLRQNIEDRLAALGGQVYALYQADKQDVIIDEIKSKVKLLKTLREGLKKKDQDLKELTKAYEDQSISMRKLKAFKDELEASGGTVEHLIVDHRAPYVGMKLREIEFPEEILMCLISREGTVSIPYGNKNWR